MVTVDRPSQALFAREVADLPDACAWPSRVGEEPLLLTLVWLTPVARGAHRRVSNCARIGVPPAVLERLDTDSVEHRGSPSVGSRGGCGGEWRG